MIGFGDTYTGKGELYAELTAAVLAEVRDRSPKPGDQMFDGMAMYLGTTAKHVVIVLPGYIVRLPVQPSDAVTVAVLVRGAA